ncbi:unnamed protein product [Sphagnum balticum]
MKMGASSPSTVLLLAMLTLVGSLAEVNATSRTASWKSLQQSKDVVPEGGLRIPSTLLDHASPLDATTVSRFAANIREGTLSQHSNEFCGAAKLTCDANMKVLDPVLRDLSLSNLQLNADLMQRTQEMIAASRAMYFGEKELTVGNQIHLPTNLNRDIFPTISFLPSSLAQLMPFSRAKMPELLQILDIPENSNLATMMMRTMSQCEESHVGTGSAGGRKTCVSSLEDMRQFVSTSLSPEDVSNITPLDRTTISSDLKDYQLDSSLTTNAEKWTRVVESKSYNQAVICQKRMFPYAVYQCQDMKISGTGPQATIYSISMEEITNNNGEVAPSSNSPRINQVAICGHINDLDLKLDDTGSKHVEAGEFERTCHWVSDAFIWGIRAAI